MRTATPAFEAAQGESFFSYLRTHPEVGDAFDGTMTRLSQGVIEEAIAHYDFAGASRVLDVGGGRGHFVRAVLNAHPWLDGAVFDVPEVAEVTARELRRTGFDDRCVAIGGSFFEALPAGYDLHVLKWILHDWNDDSCRTLLEACRAALPAGGRLLVIEQLLPESIPTVGRLHPAVAMDLTMLVNFADARERRLDEYGELLASGGFAIGEGCRCRPGSPSSRRGPPDVTPAGPDAQVIVSCSPADGPRSRAAGSGMAARTVVPRPGADSTTSRPSRAATRSARPRSPLPFAGSAPPPTSSSRRRSPTSSATRRRATSASRSSATTSTS